jgi:hypothetical protein
MVTVVVRYTDGVSRSFDDAYMSHQPRAEWIPDTVRDVIARLDVADGFTIPVGPITPSAPADPDLNIALFRKRCYLLTVVEAMVNLGLVLPTNPKVVALGNWIKNNFDAYFDTLAS